MRRCLYAGSFDPITNGHLWMMESGARLFDELIVMVGHNPDKKTMFGIHDRVEMVKASVKDIPNVKVQAFEGRFLVDMARELEAQFILRGIRNGLDYEFERGMRHLNQQLNPDVTTVFLAPPRDLGETSSSMVKGLLGNVGWAKAIRPHLPDPAYKELLASGLRQKFDAVWGKPPNPNAFDILAAHYSTPGRHYHTLEHIADCLDKLYLSPAREQTDVQLAIWFHDVVYSALEGGNEQASADLFVEMAQHLPSDLVGRVRRMILATAQHTVTESDPSTQIFLDIDLSILGASNADFDRYDAQIREEYAAVPAAIYYPTRYQILLGFLARDRIFQTDYMRLKYEHQARANLTRWLADHAE